MHLRPAVIVLLGLLGTAGAKEPAEALPKGAVARLGSTSLRHPHGVLAATFPGDGKTVLSLGADYTIRTWDVTLDRVKARKPLLGVRAGEAIPQMQLSADGKLVALGCSPFAVSLYEADTGLKLRRLEAKDAGTEVYSLAITRDGKRIAAGDNAGHVHVWSVDGKRLFRLDGENTINGLAWSTDGGTLAAVNGNAAVRLWDADGKMLRTLNEKDPAASGTNAYESAVCFSPDGKRLACQVAGGGIQLWDVATGKALSLLLGPNRQNIVALLFTPDGKTLIADCASGEVEVWDLGTGKARFRLDAHPQGTWRCPSPCVALSPDGKTLATWGWSTVVRLWDVTTGKERSENAGHLDGIRSLAFAADGKRLASGGADSQACVWDVADGSQKFRAWAIPRDGNRLFRDVRGIALSPDGKVLAAATDHDFVPRWDEAGKSLPALKHADTDGKGRVWSVTYTPAGEVIASGNGRARRWDAEGKDSILVEPPGTLAATAVSADGRLLALCSFEGNPGILTSTAAWNLLPRKIEWRDLKEGMRHFTLRRTVPGVNFAALSGDGRRLGVVTEFRELMVWGTADGKLRFRTQGRTCLAFSPDGKRLATVGERGEVLILDGSSGRLLRRLDGRQGMVQALAFGPGGKLLASGGSDGTVLLWKIAE